jgi:rhodanese-related sulfurtransferase
MSKSKSKHHAAKPVTGKPAASKGAASQGKPSSSKTTAKTSQNSRNVWLIVAAVATVAVIAAIAFLPRGGPTGTPAAASQPKEISVAQAKEKYDSGAFLLDVRQPEEWNEYHVPGSTLIPLGELKNRVGELPKDKEIVVVCRSGNRSQEGRDILLSAGFDQATSMAGGVLDWRAAGYPTVSGP